MKLFLLLILTATVARSSVLHVPSDYSSISDAVQASNEADTILVAPGTYFDNIVLPAGERTISSEFIFTGDTSAVLSTVLEPSYSIPPNTRSILEIYESNSHATLIGFTLQYGQGVLLPYPDSTLGGAILMRAGNLSLDHCLFRDNSSFRGSAVFADSLCTLSVRSCDIRDNLGWLGGIYAIGSTVTASKSRFHNNTGHWGSAIFAWEGANINIDSCLMDSAHNMQVATWGAVLVIRSTISVTNSDFISNWVDTTFFSCAGLAISECPSRVENCRFIENLGHIGAALEIGYRDAHVSNCIFLRNHASWGQGALTLGPGTHTLFDCLFDANSSPRFNTFTSIGTVYLDHCVFRNNFSTDSNDSGAVTSGYNHETYMNDCSFVGNTPTTIHNAYDHVGIMHMENCYWGDPSGPYHPTLNPNGRGGTIYGDSVYFTPWLTEPPQDVSDHGHTQLPTQIGLDVFPNPFNPTTTISFSLPQPSKVKLEVFDLLGRSVSTLTDEMMMAGDHRITFDGSSLPSGIYFTRLQAGKFAQTRKLILLK